MNIKINKPIFLGNYFDRIDRILSIFEREYKYMNLKNAKKYVNNSMITLYEIKIYGLNSEVIDIMGTEFFDNMSNMDIVIQKLAVAHKFIEELSNAWEALLKEAVPNTNMNLKTFIIITNSSLEFAKYYGVNGIKNKMLNSFKNALQEFKETFLKDSNGNQILCDFDIDDEYIIYFKDNQYLAVADSDIENNVELYDAVPVDVVPSYEVLNNPKIALVKKN